jgi:hypothetical protein
MGSVELKEYLEKRPKPRPFWGIKLNKWYQSV